MRRLGFKVKRFRDFGSEIRLRPWSARVRTWGLRIIFQTLNSKHLPFNAEPCTLDSKPFAQIQNQKPLKPILTTKPFAPDPMF
jgi:hypothetical protein